MENTNIIDILDLDHYEIQNSNCLLWI